MLRRYWDKVSGKKPGHGPNEEAQAAPGIGNMHGFLQFLKNYVGFVPNHILDVGAHRTTWSSNCKSVFPSSDYFLIEPQEEMTASLEEFCESTPGSKYLITGLGEKRETRTITIWEDQQGSSFKPSDIELDLGLEQSSMTIETIDHLVAEKWMPIPDLIKVDVQGYEKNVLEGASSVLGQTEVIILEVSLFNFMGSEDFADMIGFMERQGYLMYDIAGFHRRPYDQALAQVDVVFARKNGVLRAHKKWS